MIRFAAAALALLAAAGDQDGQVPLEFSVVQVTVTQRIVIRVPQGPARVPASSGMVRWRETGGPRCVAAREIAGAMPSANTVDLVMRDSRRVRARLAERCAGLDYYRGLYVDARPDGQICADRDAIRSRMGGRCPIVQFRQLQPVRP